MSFEKLCKINEENKEPVLDDCNFNNTTELISENIDDVITDVDTEDIKTYINELINIQKTIQSMSKYNQIEILRILKSDENIILNENKYGIFVNLTEIDKTTINKLKDFTKYINTQEMNLIQIENQKNAYKNTFFDN